MMSLGWIFVLIFTIKVVVGNDEVDTYRGGVEIEDFDELCRQYAERKAREYGRTLRWFDIYGRNKHLAERPQYSKYKVTVWSDNLKYGQVQKSVEKPGYVYSQWYHNSQSVAVVGEFTRTVELKSTFSWKIHKSVKMNTEVKASAGIPDYLGANAYHNNSVDLQDDRDQSSSRTETYGIRNTITIPPGKSVKAEFVVTEKEVQVPWEADVEIEGWIALWFEQKYEGHWLWFHPIIDLANDKFPLTSDRRALRYKASGIFQGMRGVETNLRTYEYDLLDGTDPKPRGVPLKINDYEINLQPLD